MHFTLTILTLFASPVLSVPSAPRQAGLPACASSCTSAFIGCTIQNDVCNCASGLGQLLRCVETQCSTASDASAAESIIYKMCDQKPTVVDSSTTSVQVSPATITGKSSTSIDGSPTADFTTIPDSTESRQHDGSGPSPHTIVAVFCGVIGSAVVVVLIVIFGYRRHRQGRKDSVAAAVAETLPPLPNTSITRTSSHSDTKNATGRTPIWDYDAVYGLHGDSRAVDIQQPRHRDIWGLGEPITPSHIVTQSTILTTRPIADVSSRYDSALHLDEHSRSHPTVQQHSHNAVLSSHVSPGRR